MDGNQNGAEGGSMAMTQEIAASADASLTPLKEDLADWLSKLLDVEVTSENFYDVLSTGVLPCKLAEIIQKKAEESKENGAFSEDVPKVKIKYRQNARPESFLARDNTANFLSWCRQFGVPEACLFESEGLVLQKQPRDVLVCIYELARIGSKFGIEPPGLVKLEKEIEQEEESRPVSASKTPKKRPLTAAQRLDQEVRRISGQCKCMKPFDVRKVSEGRYNVGGKVVFVRMLKGKHVMVRVGGGWDTLDHFLSRHDPCRMIKVQRAEAEDGEEYLVINGNYKKKDTSG
ncbi:growth arrest-specific protein 2-like [Ptychodera flava]|uniref:growth arrest-specific protein 2-like n=1 Tax=Ptychodera flava TaxID=63121 RepID=UPI00396A508F